MGFLMEEIETAHYFKTIMVIHQGPKSPQKEFFGFDKYQYCRYAIFYLDYEYANDLFLLKNLVLEFSPKNYIEHSDCSSLQHRISPVWLDCLLHFLYGD